MKFHDYTFAITPRGITFTDPNPESVQESGHMIQCLPEGTLLVVKYNEDGTAELRKVIEDSLESYLAP
jgi:hypothetical protein